ncbi:MAG: UDP-N-acetylmuramoyl-tripeptide--D-alanyl-D-alanine ligase [candidate division Zixibacteria bacterium]|nr:UDP-N-acetylmuramoyl-tripeptide--D-alanyl-D-alanine ligase [candidate division Zixibacteria bacterium]
MSVGWTLSQVNELAQGEILRGDGQLRLRGVVTDSRVVRPGDLFVALRGERRDGHDYVADAAARGAVAAVVAREVPEAIPQVLVRDTLEALRVLGRARRREFRGPVVAITGSCGKTTTKDLIGEVLARKYQASVARESFNTEVGVPLSILALEPGDEVLVLELGVSAPGEMARLGDAAAPTVAVITSVAPTHLEFFRDVDAVRREKMALLNYVKPSGTAVLNADDPLVAAMAAEIVNGLKVVTFGLTPGADVIAEDLRVEGFAGSRFRLPGGAEVELPLPGEFNVMNALAAAAVGQVLGVTAEDIAAGLRAYCGRDLRSKVATNGRGVTFFVDCYNSSPRAARAALVFVAAAPAEGRRVAVLGDMLELGAASEAAHRELGEFAGQGHFDLVVGLGEGGRLIAEGARAAGMAPAATPFFQGKDELADFLARELKEGDVVLLKASRAVRLEAILDKVGVTA